MKFTHMIESEDVRQFCIQNNLYTRGDNEDYSRMLASVDKLHNCTPQDAQDVIAIAKDIAEHSDASDSKIDLSLGNIAFYICEDVMHTTIEFDD